MTLDHDSREFEEELQQQLARLGESAPPAPDPALVLQQARAQSSRRRLWQGALAAAFIGFLCLSFLWESTKDRSPDVRLTLTPTTAQDLDEIGYSLAELLAEAESVFVGRVVALPGNATVDLAVEQWLKGEQESWVAVDLPECPCVGSIASLPLGRRAVFFVVDGRVPTPQWWMPEPALTTVPTNPKQSLDRAFDQLIVRIQKHLDGTILPTLFSELGTDQFGQAEAAARLVALSNACDDFWPQRVYGASWVQQGINSGALWSREVLRESAMEYLSSRAHQGTGSAALEILSNDEGYVATEFLAQASAGNIAAVTPEQGRAKLLERFPFESRRVPIERQPGPRVVGYQDPGLGAFVDQGEWVLGGRIRRPAADQLWFEPHFQVAPTLLEGESQPNLLSFVLTPEARIYGFDRSEELRFVDQGWAFLVAGELGAATESAPIRLLLEVSNETELWTLAARARAIRERDPDLTGALVAELRGSSAPSDQSFPYESSDLLLDALLVADARSEQLLLEAKKDYPDTTPIVCHDRIVFTDVVRSTTTQQLNRLLSARPFSQRALITFLRRCSYRELEWLQETHLPEVLRSTPHQDRLLSALRAAQLPAPELLPEEPSP